MDADLPNLRAHGGKFDDSIEEGSDISSSSELPAQHTYSSIPEVVKTFVTNLFAQIRQQNATEIHYLYENHFNRITEKFFKQTPWPQVDSIQALSHPENPNKPLITPEKGILRLLPAQYFVHACITPTPHYRLLFDYVTFRLIIPILHMTQFFSTAPSPYFFTLSFSNSLSHFHNQMQSWPYFIRNCTTATSTPSYNHPSSTALSRGKTTVTFSTTS